MSEPTIEEMRGWALPPAFEPSYYSPSLEEVKAKMDEALKLQRRFRFPYAQKQVPPALLPIFNDLFTALYVQEPGFMEVTAFDLNAVPSEKLKGYFDHYRRRIHFMEHAREITSHWRDATSVFEAEIAKAAPAIDPSDEPMFSVEFYHLLPDVANTVERIYDAVNRGKYERMSLFPGLRGQLFGNFARASRQHDIPDTKKFVQPSKSGLSAAEIIDTYLPATIFHTLFKKKVGVRFPQEVRMSHTHIIGGSGAGKTTLINLLALSDMVIEKGQPSVVIIDPHSDLVQDLARAKLGIHERIIFLDPRDVANPPALNVFALNQERLKTYDQATREQVQAGAIQTFDYLFTGLFGADLTAKQGVFFRYIARLMLTLPDTMGRNATILDMLKLMGDPTPYMGAIKALPDIQRDFFETDFMSKTFAQTKEQIRYRLQAIVENPTLARLFTSPETKLDFFTELNRGSIILVDAAKDFLKGGSSIFGRIIISLILQAIVERAAISPDKRRPAYLYIDEAASFFDTNIDDLLTDSRKYKCGLILAHQYLDQASGQLRASLAANTAIKFASQVSVGDANVLSREMRTSPEFILAQPKLQFATYIKGVTPRAVPIKFNPYEPVARMPESEWQMFLETNRARVSIRPGSRQEPPPSSDAPGDEDISREW